MAKKGLFSIFLYDYKKIPASVKMACFNVAFFAIGWGFGADPFFSIFVKSITSNLLLLGVLMAILPFIKLLLTLPIGELDGKVDERKVLLMGKVLYALAGIAYFLAGYFSSVPFLVGAIFINGLAGPMIFTTYQSYIRQHSSRRISCQVFGLYNAYFSITYCGAALLSAVVVPFVKLHWFYLAVVFFSLISIRQDFKLKENHTRPIRKELYKVMFKDNVYLKVFKNLREYDFHLYYTLFLQFIWGLLDYVGFIFIPILALVHNLSLSQIAVIFALTRFPYILSFFFAEVADKRERMAIMGGSLLITACLLGVLSQATGFTMIILVSIAISVCLAVFRPTVAGVLTNLISPKQRSEITGVQEFITKAGQIVGSLLFGIFSQWFGIGSTFLGLAGIIFLIGVLTFFIKNYHKKIGLLEINFNIGSWTFVC